MVSGQNYVLNEDFSIRRGITNRVSVYSRVVPYIGYEGFVQPRKGQGEARLNQYYNHFVGYSCAGIQSCIHADILANVFSDTI